MAVKIGCGSWSDQEYVGLLSPAGTRAPDRLAAYARHFDVIEINSTYYALPSAAQIEAWLQATPKNFRFDLKLHRHLFSRMRKGASSKTPTDPPASASPSSQDFADRILERFGPMIEQKRLGAFFLLMAASFSPGKHTLEELDPLIDKFRAFPLAVELRHRGWITGPAQAKTFEFYRDRGLSWIGVDMPQLDDDSLLPPVDAVTQPRLAYLRLHGRNPKYLEAKSAAERHDYLYPPRELKQLVKRIEKLAAQAKSVHVIANNHCHDFAPRTALALKKMLAL